MRRKPALGEPLTDREQEVFEGILRGETSKQIARRLGIFPRTEQTHRERVYRKLGVSFGARRGYDLVRIALERAARGGA